MLWWWHQDQDAANHVSTRAFDSEGNPLAEERELLGGDYSLIAVADEGGALRVSYNESSEQGRYFQYLYGVQFDSDGILLRGMELTPRSFPPVSSLEDFDVSRAAGGGYRMPQHLLDAPSQRLGSAGGDVGSSSSL